MENADIWFDVLSTILCNTAGFGVDISGKKYLELYQIKSLSVDVIQSRPLPLQALKINVEGLCRKFHTLKETHCRTI